MTQNNIIHKSRSYALTFRLWPEAAGMEKRRQFRAVKTIVQTLYLAPLVIASIVILIIRSDFDRLVGNREALVILFVAMVLLLAQPFTSRIRLGKQGEELEISSSLAPLVMWSTLFFSGAAGLWAMVLAAAVVALWKSRQLASYNQNPLWKPLSFFVEQSGIYVFPTIIMALIYLAAGGVFPITGVATKDWIPPLVTIIFAALLSGLILLPVAIQMNNLAGTRNSAGNLVRFYISAIALPLLMSPFAIITALLDEEGRLLALVFVLLGIYLVNRLAHHMSLAEARSRQQAHEFDRLEKLAKEIIAAPADAATLPQVLAGALPGLFPADQLAIHLFKPDISVAWSAFDLKIPQDSAGVAEESWTALGLAEDSFRLIPRVTLPGQRRTFGDALMTKIVIEAIEQGGAADTWVGGVYLLRHNSEGRALDSLAAVDSLASQIGTALTRAQNNADMLAFHKAQQELEFAGHIQTSFLPREVPQADQWQISAALVSARQTSGDFYDFIPLDGGLIGMVVADVSDKGTGAALYMALSRTLLRTYAMDSGLQPELALARTNNRIRADAESDQFVTLIYGVLDPATGILTYANAGHNPGFLIRAESGQVESLPRTGIPLGMFEEMAWEQAQIQFNPGDILLLYTDGVPEAQNSANEEYGEDRMLALGQSGLGQPAIVTQKAIIDSISDFVGDAPQFDDITLMVIVQDASKHDSQSIV